MPVMKYAEIALAVAFTLLALAAWLLQPPVNLQGGASASRSVEPMIVVVITGKRMTPEEKRLSSASDQ